MGGRLVKHARYYWSLLAEGHLTRRLFGAIVQRLAMLPGPTGSQTAIVTANVGGKEAEGDVSEKSVRARPCAGSGISDEAPNRLS